MKKILILPIIFMLNACTITKPDSHAYTYIYQHNSNNTNSNNTVPVNKNPNRIITEDTDHYRYEVPILKNKKADETVYIQDENYLKSSTSRNESFPVKDNQGIPQGYYSGWGYVTVPKTERFSDGRVVQHNHYYPAEAFGVGSRN